MMPLMAAMASMDLMKAIKQNVAFDFYIKMTSWRMHRPSLLLPWHLRQISGLWLHRISSLARRATLSMIKLPKAEIQKNERINSIIYYYNCSQTGNHNKHMELRISI